MRSIAAIAGALLLQAAAWAGTIWVDASNTSGIEDGTVAHPYNTIQEGVDAAGNGDEVVVMPGEYVETVSLADSDITSDFTLRSIGPEYPSIVEATVINADLDGDPLTPEGSALTLSGDEDATCTISGLTITGGNTTGSGGGLASWFSRAAITHCRIVGNVAAESGGGICSHEGHICDNLVLGNTAALYGGGLCNCLFWYARTCVIARNRIEGNVACLGGGGMYTCIASIHDNVVVGNRTDGSGGGLSRCEDDIRRNTIAGNTAAEYGGGLSGCMHSSICCNVISDNYAGVRGGGADYCPSYLIGNTVVGNVAGGVGGGIAVCGHPIVNCIIWGNEAPEAPQAYCDTLPPTYCCIQGWTDGGEGNTTADPLFVDLDAGDYRLLPGSPCIDSGDGYWAPDTDIAGRPSFDHPDVANTGVGSPPYADMGAYECYLRTSSSPAGLLRPGWNLVSFPLEPLEPEAAAALDDCAAAGNVIDANLFGYGAAKGYAAYPLDFTGVESGRGYWLRLTVPAVETLLGDCSGLEHRIDLAAGWNLIGHPSAAAAAWADCRLSDGVDVLAPDEAAAAGWIAATLFCYDDGYREVPRDDALLRPWYGYWLLAHLSDLTLIVPGP